MNLSKVLPIKDLSISNIPDLLSEKVPLWPKEREILKTDKYWDQKDPSPVAVPDKYNGRMMYHIYGTRGDDRARSWEMMHAVSPSPHGPWTEIEPIKTNIDGECVAAPGGVYDDSDGLVHLFVQTDFTKIGGTINHLTSDDGGYNFYNQGTVLRSIPNTHEAGVYDPQPLIVKTKDKTDRYIVYTGMEVVSHGDVFLAKSLSDSWDGPFERKKIIAHEDIPHHNQHNHDKYEWGLEGGNIVLLPNGMFLFVGVCFLPEGEVGTRQRVFGAVANKIEGPYRTIGPMIKPKVPGENGHPGVIVEKNLIRMYYQERGLGKGWRIKQKDLRMNDINRMMNEQYFLRI